MNSDFKQARRKLLAEKANSNQLMLDYIFMCQDFILNLIIKRDENIE